MEFFYLMFTKDEHYFDTYITPLDRAKIEEENEEKWKNLSSAELTKAKRVVYYHFMRDHHDKILQTMKSAYHEELTKKPPVLAIKESNN